MNVTETIRTFLQFFGDRGHRLIRGSSLVPPAGDPVMFTTAGMHPLTRYLDGLPHPQGRRLMGMQRCLRTTDLDEVGDDRHLTVFQMCGPDSEMFVWAGDGRPHGTPGTDERWMELWNHVTMRYRRHADGRLEPLPQHSVDTGLGLERLLMVVQGQPSVFDCDVFQPWMSTLPGLWPLDQRSLRLLADHLRASIAVIGDGVRPSNTGRGYVLRRLLRRALGVLWRDDATRTLGELPTSLFEHTLARFGQEVGTGPVGDVLADEERRFARLLVRGRKVLTQFGSGRPLIEADLAYLHQTHGLPPELVTDLLA